MERSLEKPLAPSPKPPRSTAQRRRKVAADDDLQRFAWLEIIPAFVYLKTADYTIRYANLVFRELFGEEVLGKKCYEVVHHRSEPCEHCPSVQVLESKTSQTYEWTPPNRGRTYQVYSYQVADRNGSFLIMTLGVDITERKRFEDALRQSEEKYRLLVGQLPAMVFRGYPDWGVDFFDRKIEALTGYAKEDFDSRRLRWCDLIPPEDLEYATRVFVEALKTDKSYVREHRIITRSGETRWVQCRGQIFCNDEGKVDYIHGVTFDITARKQMEMALAESEQKYRQLVNTLPAIVFEGYADWSIDFFDNRIEELTGYGKEEFDSRRLKWSDLILEEDREKARQVFLAALKGDRTYMREYRIRDKVGKIIWIQARGQIFCGPDGKIDKINGVLFDITIRKKAEELLRSAQERLHFLVSSSPAVVYSCKPEGDFGATFISDNVTALLGYEPQEFLQNPGFWLRNIHLEDKIGIYSEFPRVLEQGSLSLEYRFRHKNGSYRWLRDDLRLVRDAQGNPLEIVGSMTDITERKLAEEKVRESEKKLRFFASQVMNAQEQERKRISRELHDELGQEILFLKMQLRSLREKLNVGEALEPEDWHQVLSYVDDMVEDVRRLSRDLSPAILEDLGLSAALRRLVREFAQRYSTIKLHARLDNIDEVLDPGAHINVYRIFQESLTNVAKHSFATRVSVKVKRLKNRVFFQVLDNGQGFDARRNLTQEPGSRGLGLAAMEERVRMLGGAITIRSQPGAGTDISFIIEFPKKS
jgi:PAS domain S-box-containing protein